MRHILLNMELAIRWPSGIEQVVIRPKPDQFLRVVGSG